MTEQLVSFETAKLAKEKGFVAGSSHYYEQAKTSQKDKQDGYSGAFGWKKGETNLQSDYTKNSSDIGNSSWFICEAPTQSLLQKWLREKHCLHIQLGGSEGEIGKWFYACTPLGTFPTSITCSPSYNSFEEALEAALFTALKLITT
jgi:hypothetical protein